MRISGEEFAESFLSSHAPDFCQIVKLGYHNECSLASNIAVLRGMLALPKTWKLRTRMTRFFQITMDHPLSCRIALHTQPDCDNDVRHGTRQCSAHSILMPARLTAERQTVFFKAHWHGSGGCADCTTHTLSRRDGVKDLGQIGRRWYRWLHSKASIWAGMGMTLVKVLRLLVETIKPLRTLLWHTKWTWRWKKHGTSHDPKKGEIGPRQFLDLAKNPGL